jgi:RecA DNA recombination protein
MAVAHDLELLLARIGSSSKLASSLVKVPGLSLSWPGFDDLLPDGGLPRGVVELAAPYALGGTTSIALAAVRAGQANTPHSWCAWIDPERTLHAPGVAAAGVDLSRMLVVCPPRSQLGRISVKVVGLGAFEVVVVDFHGVPRSARMDKAFSPPRFGTAAFAKPGRKDVPPEVLVRKLALSAEQTAATVLLLTDSTQPRSVAWPTALRLELGHPSRAELSMRVAKDRKGRVSLAKTVPFFPVARATG